jgi:hypothetical protein
MITKRRNLQLLTLAIYRIFAARIAALAAGKSLQRVKTPQRKDFGSVAFGVREAFCGEGQVKSFGKPGGPVLCEVYGRNADGGGLLNAG